MSYGSAWVGLVAQHRAKRETLEPEPPPRRLALVEEVVSEPQVHEEASLTVGDGGNLPYGNRWVCGADALGEADERLARAAALQLRRRGRTAVAPRRAVQEAHRAAVLSAPIAGVAPVLRLSPAA